MLVDPTIAADGRNLIFTNTACCQDKESSAQLKYVFLLRKMQTNRCGFLISNEMNGHSANGNDSERYFLLNKPALLLHRRLETTPRMIYKNDTLADTETF